MARQLGDRVNGKRFVGDNNPMHFQRAHHYHVHDVNNEKRACNVDQIVAAGHVQGFSPDTLTEAESQRYVRCEHCLSGRHCPY